MNKNIAGRQLFRVGISLLMLMAIFGLRVVAQQAAAASPDPSQPWTLDKCIEYALDNNKNIENARFDTYIAQKQVNEFRGVGLPQVTVSGSYTNFLELPVSIIDVRNFPSDPSTPAIPEGLPDSVYFQVANFGIQHNAEVKGEISQLLFDGGFLIGLRAAKEFVNLSQINVLRTEEEVAVNVAKAYYSALLNEERSRLLQANLSRLDSVLNTTRALYTNGFAEKIDVDRLTIQRNNLQVEMQKTRRLVDLGYDLLKFQMGMPIDKDIELADKIEDQNDVLSLEEMDLVGNYADNRIEMALLNQQMTLQELNIKRNNLGYLGTLAAFGSSNYSTARPRFFELDINPNWFRSTVVGISYNLTLFDGLQKQARVQQAQLEISKIRNNMQLFEQGVALELRKAVVDVENAYANVQNARRNLDLAQEVSRVSNRKYEEGLGSNLEVIDAESTLLESQINYLAAIYDYTLSRVELRRVKGEFAPEIPTENIENE